MRTEPNQQTFPHGDPTNGGDIGLTIRQEFVRSMAQGLLSNSRLLMNRDELAREAIAQADALIAALNEDKT